MAGKKNSSLSDKEVKNAAGGVVRDEDGAYKVYDNDTGELVLAITHGEHPIMSQGDANTVNYIYHEGKAKGFKKGYDEGFNAGLLKGATGGIE